MTDFSLTLGPVAFAGFEIPSSIALGGKQRLAIHKLPGGVRIIDAMGPDPADLGWSGIFTGPDAAERARILDTMRMAGLEVLLSWDAFLYTVVIESFEADYRSPWWIPYRLSCAVVRDEAAAAIETIVSGAVSIVDDLTSAGGFATAASAAIGLSGATTVGTAAYAAANASLASTIGNLNTQIAATEPAIQANDVPTAADACGLLAQLTAARAYVSRASRNLTDAST
jgi:hypothetical protein